MHGAAVSMHLCMACADLQRQEVTCHGMHPQRAYNHVHLPRSHLVCDVLYVCNRLTLRSSAPASWSPSRRMCSCSSSGWCAAAGPASDAWAHDRQMGGNIRNSEIRGSAAMCSMQRAVMSRVAHICIKFARMCSQFMHHLVSCRPAGKIKVSVKATWLKDAQFDADAQTEVRPQGPRGAVGILMRSTCTGLGSASAAEEQTPRTHLKTTCPHQPCT